MGNIGRKLRERPIILEPFPDEAPAEPDLIPEPAAEPEPVPAGSWLKGQDRGVSLNRRKLAVAAELRCRLAHSIFCVI